MLFKQSVGTQKSRCVCIGFLYSWNHSLHGVDLLLEFRFQVSGLVLVDDGTLGELVDDGNHLGQTLGSDLLVLKGAEIAQGIAHGLGVVTVLDSFLLVGTDSFFCRAVMCHNSLLNFLFYCFVVRAGFEPAILRMKILRPRPTRRTDHFALKAGAKIPTFFGLAKYFFTTGCGKYGASIRICLKPKA